MTLVCCTLTEHFSLISGDTHVTNENGGSRIDKKVFKYEDILIGGAGSGGVIAVIPQIMANYKKGTAYKHMQAVANLFKDDQEKVYESKYSQFLYISRDELGSYIGVVDTRGDHQILRKSKQEDYLIWQGIGEPNLELLKTSCTPLLNDDFNLKIAKRIHENYIEKVSKYSYSVNNKVTHETITYE